MKEQFFILNYKLRAPNIENLQIITKHESPYYKDIISECDVDFRRKNNSSLHLSNAGIDGNQIFYINENLIPRYHGIFKNARALKRISRVKIVYAPKCSIFLSSWISFFKLIFGHLLELFFPFRHIFLLFYLSTDLLALCPVTDLYIFFMISADVLNGSSRYIIRNMARILARCRKGLTIICYVFTFLKRFKYELVNCKPSKNKYVFSFT